ncbi:baseplate assembly protein [Brevundimonas pishanensis]|uniref:baseplate assembly protein n=1 Tax=Brevundimonas pishanensis TaxID=2896315 RepID=UPI001FA7DCA6|nr:baseplate J/gp47 family protein [Brevundimonas pishanensis]
MTQYSGPSGGTTAVDLSRLPFPAVIETLSFEQIAERMKADLIALIPETAAVLQDESEVLVKLIQIWAYRELNLRQRVNDAAKAMSLPYATGSDLDVVAAPFATRMILTPADPLTGAPAVMENDSSLRERAMLGPEGFSVAGPAGAYVKLARQASPDVLDASCTSPEPGTVLVSVLSRDDGGVADQALIDQVMAAVSAEDVRPLTDYVVVASAEIIPFEVEAVIKTFNGPDSEVVMTLARSRLDEHIARSYRLGRDITRSSLIAALCPDGVQDVNLIKPAASIVIEPEQAALCTGITITHGGLAE